MYKRLTILTMIIVAALCGLTALGYHAIERWSEGLRWKRLGEFAEVAEQIRQDVDRKLGEFIQAEERRPYTHYQDYYVPDNIAAGQQQMPRLVSPLSGRIENNFAYGYFQIEPDGRIVTANDDILQREGATAANNVIYAQTEFNRANIKNNLLPVLGGEKKPSYGVSTDEKAIGLPAPSAEAGILEEARSAETESQRRKAGIIAGYKGQQREADNYYPIESLQKQDRQTQVIAQQRSVYVSNVGRPAARDEQQVSPYGERQAKAPTKQAEIAEQGLAAEKELAYKEATESPVSSAAEQSESVYGRAARRERLADRRAANTLVPQMAEPVQPLPKKASEVDRIGDRTSGEDLAGRGGQPSDAVAHAVNGVLRSDAIDSDLTRQASQGDLVQVEQGPFETIVTNGGQAQESVFGKQIFLVRDVQIEDRRFRQGFGLNEKRLIEEVRESASRFMREGMSFELPQVKNERTGNGNLAYTAVLDFGFGYLILYLKETVPAAIVGQTGQLQSWYFSIVGIVFLAATLGLVSLWRYARAQIKLSEKKDDFISAVSHELRTPLTSIRMYSEMLEKDWVKSEQKRSEYYRNMRQESERLSRLIENVLDFSRIQKGRKKYAFTVGDLNACVGGVVEMMAPYAAQNGFSIRTEFQPLRQTVFDNDAVKQIVVNLLDNAVKYARGAEDKTITVRTKSDSQFILVEVEDHGPGVPHRQRKKVFEEFYRLGAEATRETAGTGLGLALVKKFAEAHNGFVEILSARPAGSVFRVGLAVQV
ncbi:MAG TPA: HAMP domain-containing sensor histidine kinase [Sedimentisphaerales bacterium]|nr:HAMP domain-containing sensor histidine kinase [Sedimentisphaerales bacterium]